MSNITVELIDSMGSDLSVVNAARVSMNKVSSELNEKDKKLIDYLADHNHWSPFAHSFASFRIKAPVFVARQLVKHQVGFAWNEVSRRYVDFEPEFFVPDFWRERADNVKQGSGGNISSFKNFISNSLLYAFHKLALWLYSFLLWLDVCPEQARMVLPQSMMTEWIWSGSLMAWARMVNLRLDAHAQYETRIVADLVDQKMYELFPVSWETLTK